MAYKFSQKVQNGNLFKKAIFQISIATFFVSTKTVILFLPTNFVEDMKKKCLTENGFCFSNTS